VLINKILHWRRKFVPMNIILNRLFLKIILFILDFYIITILIILIFWVFNVKVTILKPRYETWIKNKMGTVIKFSWLDSPELSNSSAHRIKKIHKYFLHLNKLLLGSLNADGSILGCFLWFIFSAWIILFLIEALDQIFLVLFIHFDFNKIFVKLSFTFNNTHHFSFLILNMFKEIYWC
jgi:hypothetical protein